MYYGIIYSFFQETFPDLSPNQISSRNGLAKEPIPELRPIQNIPDWISSRWVKLLKQLGSWWDLEVISIVFLNTFYDARYLFKILKISNLVEELTHLELVLFGLRSKETQYFSFRNLSLLSLETVRSIKTQTSWIDVLQVICLICFVCESQI